MALAPGWRRGPARPAVAALAAVALGGFSACQVPNPAYRPSVSAADARADAPAPDGPMASPDGGGADLPGEDGAAAATPDAGCPATPDEDGDGVGDTCDNCPADPNPGQENRQEVAAGQAADGLGDACDPRPDSGGDEVLFLDTFGGTSLDPAWLGEREVFTVADGALLYDGADEEEMPALRRATAGDVLLVVRFTVLRWSAAAENRNVWVGVRGDAAGDAYRCSVRRDSGGATMLAFFTFGDLLAPSATRPEPIELGVTYRLAARAQGGDLTCTLGAASFVQGDVMTAAGFVELRARRAAVRLHSAIAYRLGP
jgi:hypothetical protein